MLMKYELEQIVHYLINNKPHSAPILARMLVENAHENWAHTYTIFAPFGKERIVYATVHGLIDEKDCYASKEDLLANL